MSPFIAAVALPLVLALVLSALALRGSAPASRRSHLWLAISVGMAFLAGYGSLEGAPPLVPVASKQKLFHLALAGMGLGIAALWAPRPRIRVGVAFALALGGTAWIGIRKLEDPAALALCALLATGAALSVWVATHLDRRGAPSALTPFVAAGVGVAAVALQGASASLSLLGAAVAASAGGAALVAGVSELFGGARRTGGSAAATVLALTLTGIVAALVWFTPKVHHGALACVALAPLAAALATRIPLRVGERARRVVEPLLSLGLALVPVAVAVLWASRSAL